MILAEDTENQSNGHFLCILFFLTGPFLKICFYVYECSPTCISVYHVHAFLKEARTGQQILELELKMVVNHLDAGNQTQVLSFYISCFSLCTVLLSLLQLGNLP